MRTKETKLDKINKDFQTFGLDLYLLLSYGHLIFFMMGGSYEQYIELMNEYEKVMM